MMIVTQLLEGLELTPGQLAELRAITSHYYTRLASTASDASDPTSMPDDLMLARVRDMLRDDQRVVFDPRRELHRLAQARNGARSERPR